MSVELHLPDLPEVPISLGPARGRAPRPAVPWHLRLRELLASFLPLVLMLLLALATWWLVKNSPQPPPAAETRAVRTEPDYTMAAFALERFAADGRLKLRIEGAQLRHYPATDTIEMDGVQIRAIAPDGRVTLARAARAVAAGDGSRAELQGGAELDSVDAQGRPLAMRSETLLAEFDAERVSTRRPVWVRQGSTELRAASLDYEHAAQRLTLGGPLRGVFAPRAVR